MVEMSDLVESIQNNIDRFGKTSNPKYGVLFLEDGKGNTYHIIIKQVI